MSQSQLIPVFPGNLNNTPQPMVDARALHAFLGAGKDFTNWIKDRINDYGFTQGLDYCIFANSGEKSLFGLGRPKTDYHLTLDMAKELAMVEKNERGRQARRYFIDMERQALQGPATVRPGQVEELRLARAQAELLRAKPYWRDIAHYAGLGLSTTEISRLVGRSRSTLRLDLAALVACGLLPPRAEHPVATQLRLARSRKQAQAQVAATL